MARIVSIVAALASVVLAFMLLECYIRRVEYLHQNYIQTYRHMDAARSNAFNVQPLNPERAKLLNFKSAKEEGSNVASRKNRQQRSCKKVLDSRKCSDDWNSNVENSAEKIEKYYEKRTIGCNETFHRLLEGMEDVAAHLAEQNAIYQTLSGKLVDFANERLRRNGDDAAPVKSGESSSLPQMEDGKEENKEGRIEEFGVEIAESEEQIKGRSNESRREERGGKDPRWVEMKDGQVPLNPVYAGPDGDANSVYVARVHYQGDTVPAKLVPNHRRAYVPWFGREYSANNYEVLVDCKAVWLPAHHGQVPANAYPAGKTENDEILYVGRAIYRDATVVGKVHGTALYVPYNGREVAIKLYEVLCTNA